MSTKQDDTSLDMSQSSYERQLTKYNGDDKSKKQEKTPWNRYKKFDKIKRAQVILWCKLVTFLLAACICVASFTIPFLRKARPRGIAMWQWSLLVTVLLGGPLLSKGILEFLRLFLDREFSVKENLIYYVLGLVESAWVVLWFTMVLIAWLIVVEEPSYLGMPYDKSEKIIKKFATTYPIINVTLITIIMGSFFWLLKELVLMKEKSSFHIRRFFERIIEALMYQCVIEGLSPFKNDDDNNQDDSINVISENKKPSDDDDDTSKKKKKFKPFLRKLKSWNNRKWRNTTVVDISCFDDVNQANVSCWGMKQVIDWMMINKHLTYKYKDDVDEKIKTKVIHNEEDAIKAAEFIFSSLFPDHQQDSNIGEDKLKEHFHNDELRKRVNDCLYEGAGAQKINKEVFKKWMVKAHKKRISLAHALAANKRLFGALNRFINVLIVFFIFALWLIMVRAETRRVIFVIATAIAGSAFIFGDTCKKILENLLFVFLVHPFDIGDSCLIDNTPVIIKGIYVLSTTVVTLDNEIKHYPNAALAGQTISNYTRSKHMGDMIEFPLDASTSTDTIKNLKTKLEGYIKENKQYWSPEHNWVMEFGEMGNMKMKLYFHHTINYHDFRETQARKSILVSRIKEILYELKVLAYKKD